MAMSRISFAFLKREYKLTDGQLKQKCSQEHLDEVAPNVGNNMAFANKFKLPEGEIKNIKVDRDLNYIQQTQAVFLWWAKNCSDASYENFLKVCVNIPEGDIARKMCKLCASVPVPDEAEAAKDCKKQGPTTEAEDLLEQATSPIPPPSSSQGPQLLTSTSEISSSVNALQGAEPEETGIDTSPAYKRGTRSTSKSNPKRSRKGSSLGSPTASSSKRPKTMKVGKIKGDIVLMNVSKELGEKWMEVGVALGIEYSDLTNTIEDDPKIPHTRKPMKMLQKWKSLARDSFTYETLAAALEKVELHTCAQTHCYQ